MMELRESKSTRSYNVIHGNNDIPWYRKHKRTLVGIFAILCIILIVTILFVRLKCQNCGMKSRSATEYLLNLELLLWNGTYCSSGFSHCPTSFKENPPLIIVSLDGFKPEYLSRGLTPTLSLIADCGVKTDMYPVYPSRTFPNHYSIVTGLYPSSHGVIDNAMYDTELKKLFKVGKTLIDDPRWWQKEPIWVTAGKQGKYTATYFWPGSDVKINGSYPDIHHNYDTGVPYETRVDTVLEWITSEKKPDFITLYFDGPDTAAHEFGPQSQELNDTIVKVDSMINRLLYGLQVNSLTNCVNLIVVSDHGMSEIDCNNTIDTRKYIDTKKVHSFVGAFGRLKPKENLTSVSDIVSSFQCKEDHLRVYRKEELPVRMHYAENPRIEPVILDIDSGYYIVDQDVWPGHWRCSGGNHGYDNIFEDMRAIFLAYGPSFKRNITIEPFLNIELYELMCELIDIIPQPNNGTRGSLHEILKQPKTLLPQEYKLVPPTAERPKNEDELISRHISSNCSCRIEPESESFTQLTDNQTKFHLPFGVPHALEENLVLLHNKDYIVGYNIDYNFPKWIGFTISETKTASDMFVCWSSDLRIENASCSIVPDGFIQKPLYPPRFSNTSNTQEAFYITNSVLKSIQFVNLLEDEMNNIIEKRLTTFGSTNVVMGPVFDPVTKDERRLLIGEKNELLVIPSHIFVVLTWCTANVDILENCDSNLLNVTAFILPNFPYADNCQNGSDVVKKNVARVADVEKAAELELYTDLPIYDAVRLRTSMSHLIL